VSRCVDPRDERGAALLLALGFLVFFGLVVGAMLTFTGASVLASDRLRDQRATAYAADGAMDAAIQVGRVNPGLGAYGASPCMKASAFTSTATTTDATVATVTCESIASPMDLDRTVRFTATVGGIRELVATVLFHDGTGTSPPGVEVLSWTYCGHDTGSCP
jgi:hypothetical protein